MNEIRNQNSRNLPTEEQVESEAKRAGEKTFGILPIAKIERKKFIIMSFQFFLISFIYAVLRELKDTFTLSRQLPASIAVLKLAFVPPVSIFASTMIAKLLTITSNRKILMYLLIGYVIYFFFYGIVILPFQEEIEPSTHLAGDLFSDEKMSFKGVQSLAAVIVSFTCWTSTLHFIAAEIWGSAVLSLLFMSFSNDVCPFGQFIRFMPRFYIFSNVALIFSFGTIQGYTGFIKSCTFYQKALCLRVFFVVLGVLAFGIFALGYYLKACNLTDPLFIIKGEQIKKKKQKVGFTQGIKLMFKSKLVLAICAMTLAYNIGTNMIESNFKTVLAAAKKSGAGTDSASIMKFLSYQQIIVGTIVIILLITPFSRLIQIFGWFTMGIVPPFSALLGFICVFCIAIYNTSVDGSNIWFMNRLFESPNMTEAQKASWIKIEVYLDLLFAALFKITKYAAFDMAKETISMRINKKYRARFKGIYDGVCGKLGKAGGALLLLVCNIILNTNDIRESSLIYLSFSLVIFFIWFFVVKYLANKYEESIRKNQDIDIDLIGKGGFDDEVAA